MVRDFTGAEVLQQLAQAASLARVEAEHAERAARAVRDRVETLTSERLQTLRELAATQLPELSEATAGAAMPEVATDLQQFERQRQARAQQLAAQLAEHERTMATTQQQLTAMTTQLDQVVLRRDELQKAAAALARDAVYPSLASEATQAEVCLARDTERAAELAAEAKQKLPPYEQSKLFSYLWRREFGTPAYARRGFSARLDRWVADYIGYRAAMPSYRFLKTTPELVKLEVERRTAEVQALRQRLDGMEQAAEAEVGVPAVQTELDRLLAERDRLVAAIEALRPQLAAVHATMRDEVGSRGVFHAQALQRLQGFLARAESATLERSARNTPDPRDDQLVAALRACTEALQRCAAEAPPLEQEAVRKDAIADGLEDLVVRFRRADFDAGRSEFHGLDLDGVLVDARRGGLPAGDLWTLLRARQSFRAPPPVHHVQRSSNVLHGIGLAIQVAGVLADVVGSGSRRHSSSSSPSSRGGRSSTGGAFGGGSGGFSTGRTFGGGGGSSGGGGFTTGRSF